MMQYIGRDKVGLEMVILTKNTLWDGVSIATFQSVCEPFRLRAGWNGMDVPLLWPLEQMIYQDFHKRRRSGAFEARGTFCLRYWNLYIFYWKIKKIVGLLQNREERSVWSEEGGLVGTNCPTTRFKATQAASYLGFLPHLPPSFLR